MTCFALRFGGSSFIVHNATQMLYLDEENAGTPSQLKHIEKSNLFWTCCLYSLPSLMSDRKQSCWWLFLYSQIFEYTSWFSNKSIICEVILCFTKSSQQLNHPDWLEYEYKCIENVCNGWCMCTMQCIVHVQHLHVTCACIYKKNSLCLLSVKN